MKNLDKTDKGFWHEFLVTFALIYSFLVAIFIFMPMPTKGLNMSYTTISNMTQFLKTLSKKKEIEELCKEKSLNIGLLKPYFEYSMQGYNNKEIAEKIGVHRITVQRYTAILKGMEESKFKKIYRYILGDRNEKNS